MSERSPGLLLEDILEAAGKIIKYTSGLSFDEFRKQDVAIDAVIRNFEIIGEAANRLPQEFRDRYSGIDWHRIRGFRNRIVHDYFGVDLSILWKIKTDNIPDLVSNVQSILDEL